MADEDQGRTVSPEVAEEFTQEVKMKKEMTEGQAGIVLKFVILEVILVCSIILFMAYSQFDTMLDDFQGFFWDSLPLILMIALIISLTKLIIDMARPPFERAAGLYMKTHADVRMVWRVITYVIWLIVLIIISVVAWGGKSIQALLGIGVIIAALIWVLQKPISNLAAWFQIIFRRPFKIGDRIEIGGVRGYVVEITTMHTVLREFGGWMKGDTFSGRLLMVPNNAIFENNVFNYDRYAPFIYDEIDISITYESDRPAAEKMLRDAAEEVVGKEMEKNFPMLSAMLEIRDLKSQMDEDPKVYVDFAPSCIKMSVVYFCRSSERRKIKSAITRRIHDKITVSDRVNIAYPHVEVVPYGGARTGERSFTPAELDATLKGKKGKR